MNLHVLQTHESRADAQELMAVAKNIITPQSNRPVMGIVQDSLLSAFMMTSPGVTLDIAEMSNVMMWIEGATALPEPKVMTPEGPRWSGLQCMSMIFPKDFNWSTSIFQGQLLKGPLGKKALGRSHGSIIHRLYNDYGPDRTCQFINELQRINHLWFAGQGFSIGIGDMRISEETAQKIRAECANIDAAADEIRQSTTGDTESKINRMLNQTRDSMGIIAQNAMTADNCLGLMVKSGSKGSMVNIMQIAACVGQQNCSGKRMQPTLKGRTLPMFDFDDNTARSRGFVQHSYIDGLTPDEYWHHTVGGREGLIDTAVKTSITGYIQRRLVKSLESICVANDGSSRDAQGCIIQFKYGEDGLDGMSHEMMHCPFDDMDTLNEQYDCKQWPEVIPAFKMWKWNQSFRLGDKWAISVPAQRILDRYKNGGSLSAAMTRNIIQPLLNACKDVPITHAYILATLAKKDIQCSKQTLQKIVDILLKKWHKSIVAPGEMVGTIAAQSVGEPTTQMSAAYDQQVVVDINGTVKRMQIGLLVDNILNNTSRESQEMVVTHLKCVGVTPTETVAWTNITHVSRHPANGIMLRVNTKHNRSLSMTASHSFLVRRDNRVTAMPGHKLIVGDALPVVKNLPKAVTEVTSLFPLNAIAGHFIGAVLAEGYINKYTVSFCGREHDWTQKIAKPFAHLLGLDAHIKRKTPSPHTLGTEDMTTANIHSKELAKYFAEQFGKTSHHKTIPGWCLQAPDIFLSALLQSYFDGDGNISCEPGHYAIRCHSVSKTLIEMISLCLARFGMPLYINKSKYKTPAGKRGILWEGCIPAVFAKRFRDSVGFSLPEKKKRLEKMYVMKFKKGFQARVPGMSGVLSALRQYTCDTPTRKEINRIIKRGNGITIQMLHTLIGHAKQNNVPSTVLSELKQAVNADVWWDKIETIEQYKTDELVYDFTVNEKLQSFMLGNGCFVHNTLNTFHNAGNSAKNVTLGVPRFEELINASSKIKTPSHTIFTGEETGLRPEKAWKLKTELERTQVKDLAHTHTTHVQKWPELDAYLQCPDNQRWSYNNNPKRILHCILSRKKMIQSGVNLHDIIHILRTNPYAKHMIFAYNDNPTRDPHIFVKAKKSQKFFQYTKQILETTIKGSEHIPTVNIRIEGKQFVIDTEGIDLNHIKGITSMNQKTVQCNDIFAIRKVYGIEAARATILKEMHQVLYAYGIYVNHRHLMTIVDWMTFGGNITALTRHGVKKRMNTTAPLKRATFEQPVEIFHHAAVKGLHDRIEGISEQLLMGKEPTCGSRFNEIRTEPEYKTKWDQEDWQPPEEIEEDLFGDLGVDTWRPAPMDMDEMPDSSWDAHTTFADTKQQQPVLQPQQAAWQQPQQSSWDVADTKQQPVLQPQQAAWQQPQQAAWQQPQQAAWQQPQQAAWQQPQQSSWDVADTKQQPVLQPQQAAWQQPQQAAWQQPQQADSPQENEATCSPASPAYSPTSPAYSPTSPTYSPASPAYSPTSPAYSPASPAYSPASPAYSPASPAYSPGSSATESPNKRQKKV